MGHPVNSWNATQHPSSLHPNFYCFMFSLLLKTGTHSKIVKRSHKPCVDWRDLQWVVKTSLYALAEINWFRWTKWCGLGPKYHFMYLVYMLPFMPYTQFFRGCSLCGPSSRTFKECRWNIIVVFGIDVNVHVSSHVHAYEHEMRRYPHQVHSVIGEGVDEDTPWAYIAKLVLACSYRGAEHS